MIIDDRLKLIVQASQRTWGQSVAFEDYTVGIITICDQTKKQLLKKHKLDVLYQNMLCETLTLVKFKKRALDAETCMKEKKIP